VEGGTRLDARHVAILAAAGHGHVRCIRRIRIALVVTGDELAGPDGRPGEGRIRDSNTPMLASLLGAAAPDLAVTAMACPDEPALLHAALEQLTAEVDLIVTTGGMGEGEADEIRRCCRALGGRFEIEAVAMKPGRPVGQSCRALFCSACREMPSRPRALSRGGASPARPPPRAAPAGAGAAGPRRFQPRPATGADRVFPARISALSPEGTPVLDRLGKGGSARLAPLVAADGLGVVSARAERLDLGARLGFLPFEEALRL
jgi:molybdopterin molybdotransferase